MTTTDDFPEKPKRGESNSQWRITGALVLIGAGYLTNSIRGQISGGTMMTLVGAIFLFDLDWGKVWPVFLIVPGVFMLLGVNRDA